MKQGAVPGWMGLMMGSGLLGAIAAVAISVPTAAKLARLEPDMRAELPEAFNRLRKRQIVAAALAGALGLIGMGGGTLGGGESASGEGRACCAPPILPPSVF